MAACLRSPSKKGRAGREDASLTVKGDRRGNGGKPADLDLASGGPKRKPDLSAIGSVERRPAERRRDPLDHVGPVALAA